jgi:hypothetical protein
VVDWTYGAPVHHLRIDLFNDLPSFLLLRISLNYLAGLSDEIAPVVLRILSFFRK